MNYWLVKQEPESYSWLDFVKDGKAAWTGVRNFAARLNLRAMKKGDQVFEDKGIKVVVDMKSLLYLYGTELDYSGGLEGKGLFFNNPNASRTCSCGESFAV